MATLREHETAHKQRLCWYEYSFVCGPPQQRVQEAGGYSAEGFGVAAEYALAIPTLISTYWFYSALGCMPPFMFLPPLLVD
jgi:hypothetical protein